MTFHEVPKSHEAHEASLYVFAVMGTFLKDEAEGERAIEEMSRTAYEYFSRLASGPLGRRLE